MVDFSQGASSVTPAAGRKVAEHLKTEKDVYRRLNELAGDYGFRGFLVMALPSAPFDSLSEITLMTNWPQELLRRYDEADLISGSQVVDRLRRSTIPFTFDARNDADARSDGRGDTVLTLFEHVHLDRIVCIPVHDAGGSRGAMNFAGDRPPLDLDDLSALSFIANALFNRLSELRSKSKRVPGALSRREIECLHWAAAGKTTTEMAKILELSEYTVNHYLNRATRKLDSVNRVQTVAKAIRAGLIH